ncbi:nucleoside/nucleotide kinase family protein [Kribbella sp. CA-293567]|uniref:nucleoside/nucleotide kinase family protein n=1 Tax=Kribbella sp. CA-293567 TaxID=3002436 RepID=UPI0022DD32C5|nr:nucleoside/nucleotide kinase family protein [Kribbella sp. CA-293567]WBQ07123.1 nucleoside/nucleotide kinase family protein [Kribbella sp. CA-293567]
MELNRESALERAVALASRGRRAILGITGPPAAGKSTYAEQLVAELVAQGHQVALVPMDGYHLAQAALDELGLAAVKGAPQTFDGYGFVALLERLTESADETIWAPRFDRSLEDSIAASIPVPPETTLVVTEGNYLLFDGPPWSTGRALLDECWYIELDDELRHERLVARHQLFGRSPEQAHERAFGSDEDNALLIAATKPAADAIVTLS